MGLLCLFSLIANPYAFISLLATKPIAAIVKECAMLLVQGFNSSLSWSIRRTGGGGERFYRIPRQATSQRNTFPP